MPSKGKTIKADVEDNFLRRVYRNISEMTAEINAKRAENRQNGFLDAEVKEEIRFSHEQIKEGIKDFFGAFIPGKKA